MNTVQKLVERYNALDGKTVSRKELSKLDEVLFDTALFDAHPSDVYKIKEMWEKTSKLLVDNPKATEFQITVKNPIKLPTDTLNAPRHKGIAKQGLSECGRLKKGYKYVKGGKIVKISVKKSTSKKEKSKKSISKKTIVKREESTKIIGYAIVDTISGDVIASQKILSELKKVFLTLEPTKGFEDVKPLIYQVEKIKNKNKLTKKIVVDWIRSSETKKEKSSSQFALFGTSKNKDTTTFNKDILEAKRNGVKPRQIFKLGKTKSILLHHAGSKEMFLTGATIKKAMTKDKDHVAQWHHFINLPDNLNNPLAIFKSKTKGFVVLTELKSSQNKPLMVAIHLNEALKITEIKSLYFRGNTAIYKKWKSDGLLIYLDKKSGLTKQIFGTIPKAIVKPQNKSTKTKPKNQVKPIKLNAGVNEKPTLTAENEERKEALNKGTSASAPQTKNIATLKKLGFTLTSDAPKEAKGVFRLDGEIGKLLQNLQRHKELILIKGTKHTSKSQLAMQIANAFGEKDMLVAYIDYEQGGIECKDTIDSVNRNATKKGRKNILIKGFLDNPMQELEQYCKYCDVIVADSITDLGISADQVNELRGKYQDVIWTFISQVKSDGEMYGGNKMAHNPTKIINCHPSAEYKDRYATLEKNRGNDLSIRYNIFSKKTFKEAPEKEKAVTKKTTKQSIKKPVIGFTKDHIVITI